MIKKIKSIFKKKEAKEEVKIEDLIDIEAQKEWDKTYPARNLIIAKCSNFVEQYKDSTYDELELKYEREDCFLLPQDKTSGVVKKLTGSNQGVILKGEVLSGALRIEEKNEDRNFVWVVSSYQVEQGNAYFISHNEDGFIRLRVLKDQVSVWNRKNRRAALENAIYDKRVKRIMDDEFEGEAE